MHLSLVDLESWLPGRGLITKANGVQNSSDHAGAFGPKVCRVFLSEPGVLSSGVSGPEIFLGVGPSSLARRKRRLCKILENGNLIRSAAILAQLIKLFDCKNSHRAVVRAGIKDSIMVIITKR